MGIQRCFLSVVTTSTRNACCSSILQIEYQFGIMRGNILHVLKCRLVMYIERDSRKTTAGKEQQSGNEYLSKCLDLLIHHIVRELPGILGKLSWLTEQILSLLTPLRNTYVLPYIYRWKDCVFWLHEVCMLLTSWSFLVLSWSDILHWSLDCKIQLRQERGPIVQEVLSMF